MTHWVTVFPSTMPKDRAWPPPVSSSAVDVEGRSTPRGAVDRGRARTGGLTARLVRRLPPSTRRLALAVVFLAGPCLTGCAPSLRDRTARLDLARPAPTAESAMFDGIMGAECRQMAVEDQERAEAARDFEPKAVPRREEPLRTPARRPPW